MSGLRRLHTSTMFRIGRFEENSSAMAAAGQLADELPWRAQSATHLRITEQ